jgi:hypothetical protein
MVTNSKVFRNFGKEKSPQSGIDLLQRSENTIFEQNKESII